MGKSDGEQGRQLEGHRRQRCSGGSGGNTQRRKNREHLERHRKKAGNNDWEPD